MQPTRILHLDKIGAYASAICAVHCLLTGVALGLLSTAGLGFLESPLTDALFIGTAAVVGVFAVVHGKRAHGSHVPAYVFIFGLSLILGGHFLFGHGHDSPSILPTLFSVVGGLSIVAFHVLNWRLQRVRKCCHVAHCQHAGNFERLRDLRSGL